MMNNEDKIKNHFINNENDNILNQDYQEISPYSLTCRNKTKEFKELRNTIQLNKNMVWEKLKPKVKLATINKSNLLNDDMIIEKSKLVHQCSICETRFGLIKNKKQICLICKLVVCSDCNYNPIPFKELRIPSNNQMVYTCKNCFTIMDNVAKKEIFEFEIKKAMSSSFSQFYEQMDLNMVDLKSNLPKFKELVEKIQNRNSPLLTQAKELEKVVSIIIKEYENGVRQLKLLQGSTPKQQQVISNMKHCFALYLQSALPQFKFASKQLIEKSLLQPVDNSNNNSSSNNSNSKTKDQSTIESSNISNNSKNLNIPNNNNNNSSAGNNITKSPPLLSSFISSFSNLLKPSQPIAATTTTNQLSQINQEENDYENSIDRSKIISVVPAVCPMRGGAFIAITGENLNKPTITIEIGGILIAPFKQNINAILILSPSQNQEGEVDIVISDGPHILSEQQLIFTDLVYQTETDLNKANDQALNTFQKSTTSPLLNSSGESLDNNNNNNRYNNQQINIKINNNDNINSNNSNSNSAYSSPKLNSYNSSNNNSTYSSPKYPSPRTHHREGSNSSIDSILSNHDNIIKNYIGNSKVESYSQYDNYQNQSPSSTYSIMKSEWGKTGDSHDDIIVEMVHPLQSSLKGDQKISVQFKNSVKSNLSISVAGIPVNIIERSYDDKKVSFLSPSLNHEGKYNIDFYQDSKHLPLKNIITYERSLPIDEDDIRAINRITNQYQFKEQPQIKTSSRILGKKVNQN